MFLFGKVIVPDKKTVFARNVGLEVVSLVSILVEGQILVGFIQGSGCLTIVPFVF